MTPDAIAQDLRFAVRALRRRPLLASTAILSVALAIGAGASAVSVVDAIRFRALPFADADRLILISEVPVVDGATTLPQQACAVACNVSYATFSTVLRDHPFRSLSAISGYTAGGKAFVRDGQTEGVQGGVITPNILPLLRATPLRGRAITAEDDRLGAEPVALLSYQFWASRFGSDPRVLGSPIQLSDTRYTVVGIMPQGFDFESGAQFWLPMVPTLDPSTRPSIRSITVIGHLAPDQTIARANAELAGLEPAAGGPRATTKLRLAATPLRTRYAAATQGNDLIFLAVVACVLLIACANLTNLFLVRALDQQREMAVRAALGAGKLRLGGQVILQHAIVVMAGTAIGLMLASWCISLIGTTTVLNSFRPTGMNYRLDARVIAVALSAAVLMVIVVSAMPVRMLTRGEGQTSLRDGGGGGGTAGGRLQRLFVAAQLACAVVLLVAAVLQVKAVRRLSRTDLGFDVAPMAQGTGSYPHDWRVKSIFVPVTQRILEGVNTIPGVEAAATRALAASGSAEFTLHGQATALARNQAPAAVIVVSPGYFQTLRIPITRGRAFTADDREQTSPVAIVNQWAADRWWPGEDPLGRVVRIDSAPGMGTSVMVVGVVRDNRAASPNLVLATDGPELYRPYDQAPSAFPAFLARARGSPEAVLKPLQALLAREVPNRPVSTQLVSSIVEQQLSGVRLIAAQVSIFAAVGFFIAIVGIHGVVAFAVSRRTRELGIRRALGATEGGVRMLVLREALAVAAVALIIGGIGARFMGRAIAPLLYGADPGDPGAYALTAGIILAATLASAFVPANRAARVAPVTALRSG